MDDVPKTKSVLEPVRGQNVRDHFWSETMTDTTPKGGQAELSIGVHGRSFQETFFRTEKLTDKRVVQSGLPFLNEGHWQKEPQGLMTTMVQLQSGFHRPAGVVLQPV